ncbi:MAG: phosphate starvation-inducible protein PsiF [Zoogloeaceae bacterium]|nr:phosphate starvation-inducible protein PsiF [Zoogloeaceae bacterium]
MKIAIALVSLALAAGSAFAAAENAADAPKKAPTAAQKAQQDKMKACNAKATGKKGDERKAFMKECLSGGTADATAADPACENKAAEKKLAGAAKNSFVKKCTADATAAK